MFDRAVKRRSLHWSPDRQRDPTSRGQHPVHLVEALGSVGEELQSLLASDQVELRCAKWQIEPAADMPFDLGRAFRRYRFGDLDHARAQIETCDPAGGSDQRCKTARDDARSARDIERAGAWFGP